MPLSRCEIGGKPGWRWGRAGKCYSYDPDDEGSEAGARKKALAQAAAMGEVGGGSTQGGCGRVDEREAERLKKRARHGLTLKVFAR